MGVGVVVSGSEWERGHGRKGGSKGEQGSKEQHLGSPTIDRAGLQLGRASRARAWYHSMLGTTAADGGHEHVLCPEKSLYIRWAGRGALGMGQAAGDQRGRDWTGRRDQGFVIASTPHRPPPTSSRGYASAQSPPSGARSESLSPLSPLSPCLERG